MPIAFASVLQAILPELSNIIIIFAGVSLVPVPGGGDFELAGVAKINKIKIIIFKICSIFLSLSDIQKFYFDTSLK